MGALRSALSPRDSALRGWGFIAAADLPFGAAIHTDHIRGGLNRTSLTAQHADLDCCRQAQAQAGRGVDSRKHPNPPTSFPLPRE